MYNKSMQKLQDKFIEINGAKIHYIEEGNGKPVILFHGARFNARTWEETGTLEAISKANYRAISVDFPGFGLSQNLSMDFPEFIKAFISSMNFEKAILLGASMGGEAILGFSVKYPNLTEALILVGAVGVQNYQKDLDKISNIPTLLIWGKRDNVSPKRNYEILLSRLKNVKLELIGENHACYLDDPRSFNQKVVDFIKGLK